MPHKVLDFRMCAPLAAVEKKARQQPYSSALTSDRVSVCPGNETTHALHHLTNDYFGSSDKGVPRRPQSKR
jgi:hypothetical protein